MENKIEIMREIMGTLFQTDEFIRLIQSDPESQKTNAALQNCLQEVKKYIPRDLFLQVSNAICENIAAENNVCILYGLHVADAFHTVSAYPEALLRQSV